MIKEKAEEKNEYLTFNRDEVVIIRDTYFHLSKALEKLCVSKSKRKDKTMIIECCEIMVKKCDKFLNNEEETKNNV